eukprot:UN05966
MITLKDTLYLIRTDKVFYQVSFHLNNESKEATRISGKQSNSECLKWR